MRVWIEISRFNFHLKFLRGWRLFKVFCNSDDDWDEVIVRLGPAVFMFIVDKNYAPLGKAQ